MSKKSLLSIILSAVFCITFNFITLNAFAISNVNKISFNNPIVDAAEEGDLSRLEQALRNGIHVDSRGDFSTTALMRAVNQGNTEIVDLLIKAGADVDLTDLGGASALHVAAKKGHGQIVKLLIEAGADVNAIDDNGFTAIMRAISSQDVSSVSHLIKAGAKTNITNAWGQNAMTIASQLANEEIINELQNLGQFDKLTNFDKEMLSKIAKSEKNSAAIKIFENDQNLTENNNLENVNNAEIANVANINKTEINATEEKEINGMPWLSKNVTDNTIDLEETKIDSPKINIAEIKKNDSQAKPKTIAEAVRVPLSDLKKMKAKQKTNFIVKHKTAKTISRFEPSNASLPYKSFWLETSPFRNVLSAKKALNDVIGFPEFKKLRIRFIKSMNQSGKMNNQQITSIRLGPIYDTYMAKRTCKILMGDENECRIIRDLKKSTANLRKKKDNPKIEKKFQISNYELDKSWIQFASFTEISSAKAKIQHIKNKFRKLSQSGNFVMTTPSNSSGKKTLYRLRFGPFDTNKEAISVCTKFRNLGTECIIVKH